jgi:glycosyltransferase involved in cell wall biosynthesis
MILTVAIPTYNRPDKISDTIKKLIPQLVCNVQVMVLDNHSDTIILDYLKSKFNNLETYPIKVVRHPVNIGPDANFARCFELCDTPWIWTLGDDDLVNDNAIQNILYEIEAYKNYDLIGFNFNSNCNLVKRDKPIIISNTREMANKLDFFGNWLFISTAVYNTKEYFKHIRFATWGAYSMVSQIVPAMVAISNNKTFVLSEKTIADNGGVDDVDHSWSSVHLSMVITTLLEAPVNFNEDYKAFGKKLAVQQLVPIGGPAYTIIKSVNDNLSLIDDYHLYLYKQFYYRSIDFRKQKFKALIMFRAWYFLLKHPAILALVMKLFKSKFDIAKKAFGRFHLFVR